MTRTAWRRGIMMGVLAVSMTVFPIAAPLDAQQPGTPQTETRAVDTDENDVPWGLLGLLGLLGLAGLRRPPVARRLANDPTSRRA
jgi:MYXO-CTERM domain-containing protein